MQPYHNYKDKFPLPNGKMIYLPTEETRRFGIDLIRWVLRKWRRPGYFYHLRQGGHVAAARNHLNDSFFLRCDLSRCFDHVTRSKIHRTLKSLGFGHKDAWEFACKSVVAKISQERALSLPFGFPQSPILASVAIDRSALGAALRRIRRGEVRISVYMDDLLLSAGERHLLEQAFGTIVEAAKRSGFSVNASKTAGPAEAVDVFNLRLTNGGLSVTEQRMSRFQEAVLRSNPFVVDGVIGYVGTVNKVQAARLRLLSARATGSPT
jgi:Reverse transcriptase (RNA-dependent DNA polymerase)